MITIQDDMIYIYRLYTIYYIYIYTIYIYTISPKPKPLGPCDALAALATRSAPDGPGHELGLQRPPPQRRCHRDGRIRRSRCPNGVSEHIWLVVGTWLRFFF